MDIATMSKQEFIKHLLSAMVTPNIKPKQYSEEDNISYANFITKVKTGAEASVNLPLDFALKDELFNLIKNHTVFIESSIKFRTNFTTKRPTDVVYSIYTATYKNHEFEYSFLDNHPGILNIDKLKDIPVDYEGLMAVPPTVLEYKNLRNFNIHRVLYTPKHNGKMIYYRVVISNKIISNND